MSNWIVVQCRQDVFRTVSHPVNDVLYALVALSVPNLYNLICSKTDEMVSLFVDIEVANRSVMAVKVSELLQSVRLPEDDVALFTTTGNLLVLLRVNEAIDTLLMQIKRSFLSIVEVLEFMHVDKAVKRAGQEHDQVLVILDLCYPSPVRMHL